MENENRRQIPVRISEILSELKKTEKERNERFTDIQKRLTLLESRMARVMTSLVHLNMRIDNIKKGDELGR
jgi:hypothetical protein